MTRLEKIVLEQTIRKGNMGVRKIDGPLSSRTAKYFTNPDDLVTSFYYVDKHGKGTKYTPLTSNELVQRWLPTLFELQKYNTKDYIIILDTDSQVTDKTESVWDVFVANRNSISKIPDLDIKKLGNVGSAPLISLIEFQRLKKQAELVAAKEKADSEAAAIAADAEKNKPAIEKTIVAVQNVVNGTATIDVNNLGKGTEDAKAFQELLWQYGNKYPTQKSNTIYINFAKYRTKGPDGGWDGEIGPLTKKYITFLYGGLKVNTYTELIKKINLDLNQVQTESINYFKGTGINIKLKDLLQEQLLKEQEGFDFAAAEAAVKSSGKGGGGSSGAGDSGGTTTTTTTTSSTDFTEASFPRGYGGSGTITYNNGDTFTGSWVNGLKSGPGKFTKFDTGITIEGEWKAGKKNGIITFTLKDGTTIQQTWKDGVKVKSNETYWSIAKNWVIAEYNFWEKRGTGPEGQKRPVSHKDMFDQFNSTGFGNFIGNDYEVAAKNAYLANRKLALTWLDNELAGCVAVTGQDYYGKIKKWIYDIADEIDDVFQNDQTIELTNDAEGDTITRTVQGEIDVDW
jgi:hypothetical protein